jgi:HK97 family phage major capsid protein
MYATMRVSRGLVLRKQSGIFGALFNFLGLSGGGHGAMSLGTFAIGLVTLCALVALALAAVLSVISADVGAGFALATVAPLVTRNREANELMAQADKIVEEVRDISKPLTADELKTKMDAVASLKQRAAFLAEHTADAEARRQGAEDLTPIKPGEEAEREDFETHVEAVTKLRKVAAKGFRNMGEFLRVIRDPRAATDKQRATLATMRDMTRAITGDGSAEVLLPLQQESSIWSVSNQQEGILQRARRYPLAGRSLRIPMLEQTEGTNTLNRPMAGKIANVTFVAEAAPKPQRDPVFTQRLLVAQKVAATTQIGDEILADDFTGQLPGTVTEAVGTQVMNFLNEQFTIDGATAVASGGPMGALNAANTALLTVDRDTANSVKAADVFNMYERFAHGNGAVWFASRRVLRPLMELTLNGNTLVTWLSNFGQKPQMMLLGYPVIISDLLPTLGTAGDLGLVNPDFYALGMRQGLTVESSIHEFFSNDITVWRFLSRAAGCPLPTSTYAYKFQSGAKVDEYSPFVRLGLPTSS